MKIILLLLPVDVTKARKQSFKRFAFFTQPVANTIKGWYLHPRINLSTLGNSAHIHIGQFPLMAVQILETALVHPALVLWIVI